MKEPKQNPTTAAAEAEIVNISFKMPIKSWQKLEALGYRSANQAVGVATRFWAEIFAASIKEMKAKFDDEQLSSLQAMILPASECGKDQLIALAQTQEFDTLMMNRLNSLSRVQACILIDMIQRGANLIATI